MKPSRLRSNGRDAFCGASLRSREGGEQVEAGDAEGMDHAVGAAGEHDVGVAAADDLGRLADGLAAGGAGGEAVEVRAFGAEVRGDVGDRHVRFLLELELRVEALEAFLDERGQVEFAVLEGGDHHVAEVVEVLLAFAGAEVDAEAVGVDGAEDARIVHGLAGRRRWRTCVWRPRFSQDLGVFAVVGDATSCGLRPRCAWGSCWRRRAW